MKYRIETIIQRKDGQSVSGGIIEADSLVGAAYDAVGDLFEEQLDEATDYPITVRVWPHNPKKQLQIACGCHTTE